MNRLFGFLIVFVLLLSSCIKQDDISVTGVEDISMSSMSNIDMTLGVENLSGRNVSIESAKFRLDNNEESILTLILRDRVVVPKRSSGGVDLNWAVKFDNPLGAFAIIGTLKRSMSNLTVSGEIVVKAGWSRKKIELNAVPLSQIISNFGANTDDIIKSFGL